MSGSVNWDEVVSAYKGGLSLPQVAEKFRVPPSTARYWVKKAGELRSRTEGVRLASARLGEARRGKSRQFTDDHIAAIQKARRKWGEENSVGISAKTNGYVQFTRGKNKHRSVHVVKMEERIGRKLLPDECVHHIDGDKHNNAINNLALMTTSAHARLHRREERISGHKRERHSNGRLR